ncbi:hypothetical protein ACT3OH_19325 [Vreelandella zhanjiangensis]|uniref:hypothetical protein n=1 Tax=Halomonas hibernica TaxID=2591147 RepID=UPI0015555E8D|nr:hypothetical protein [Halomonas hibernica]
MIEHVEQQQGRFERLSVLLRELCKIEHDGLSVAGKLLLEEAMTEAALGSEDAQIALDEAGDKAA